MITYSIIEYFYLDSLSVVMMSLIAFIGLTLGLFSRRYMDGDSLYHKFLIRLCLLVAALVLMVTADNLFLILISWIISNLLLIQLMVHKHTWRAAKASGWLAAKSLSIGSICLLIAFVLLYHTTGLTSLHKILGAADTSNPLTTAALTLIVITAFSQSAIWPFHRWLISSLNSPTPVSAMMHAGLVNGGGILLTRWAPLFQSQYTLMTIIFVFGITSAIVGTLWKLMQNDIKKMLACSTMAQMGYMLAQCGLGLYPAAVAHLCWHGLFKANLFLSSNGVITEKRVNSQQAPTMLEFILAQLCGFFASLIFTFACQKPWIVNDTSLILTILTYMTSSQLALVLLKKSPWRNLIVSIIFTGMLAGLYGFSVWMMEYLLSPNHVMHTQPINIVHIFGIAALLFTWLAMIFKDHLTKIHFINRIWPMLYVKALNASQPHPSTITTHRNEYAYK